MRDPIPPSRQAMEEALELSGEILADVELGRVALSNAALKVSRLARLLNRFDDQQIFRFEAGGYPTTPTGIPPPIWKLLELAGRTYQQKNLKTEEIKTFAYVESIEQLESAIESAKISLQAAQDRDVAVSSANPTQYVWTPIGNSMERWGLRDQISNASIRLASRRALVYDFVSRVHYELKYSGLAQDVFSAVRQTVDHRIGELLPTAVQQFTAVHDNLRSQNPEDWSNAVHSCRRVLQSLADAVFPPTEPRVKSVGDRSQEIKLGPDKYINRLVCFAEDNSSSERFNEIVGSHLHYLGDRLDAISRAAQKGSHAVVQRAEASRYVVYTYLLVGDILSLVPKAGGAEV